MTLGSSIEVEGLHPHGAATIFAWIADMHRAAREGDTAEVARLARMIAEKVELERKWRER
jgi:hypothetical protein